MELSIGNILLKLKIGDITEEKTDAIVNAANSSLMGGGGVDGAIHSAGGPNILKECKQIIKNITRLEIGKAVVTSSGNMPSKYVIHTVGPIWQGGNMNEDNLLYDSYFNCLDLASKMRLTSISFPSISTGAYGFPAKEAAHITKNAIDDFMANKSSLSLINIVLYNKKIYEIFVNAFTKNFDPAS